MSVTVKVIRTVLKEKTGAVIEFDMLACNYMRNTSGVQSNGGSNGSENEEENEGTGGS